MSKHQIVSPLPGTFYRRPSPENPAFKNDGDAVATGDAIGVIEVMKTFHELTADAAGSAIRFLVEDGDGIMTGDVVAEIDV